MTQQSPLAAPDRIHRARRSALVRKSGPYKVSSCADGTLIVTPSWPQFKPYTPEEGGGPGLFSRMGLAHDLERWLNAPYEVTA